MSKMDYDNSSLREEIDDHKARIYELERINAELEQQLAELRKAAQEIVGWDWVNLKEAPYHVDWFEALVDVGLLEKLLQESEDVV